MFKPFVLCLPKHTPPFDKLKANGNLKLHKARSITAMVLAILMPFPLAAAPEQDQAAFREHYRQRFPDLQLPDYSNGVYAIDPVARESWRAIEEFPPYEPAIEQGQKLFAAPFKNGKHYFDCFPNKGRGIAQKYPVWRKQTGEVVTLAKAINECRELNQEPGLPYSTGDLVYLQAYMAYTSRGKAISVEIPEDDPRALSAYEHGKAFYYRRQGLFNFACATCHVQNAGKKLRAEILSASLGHTSNWPVYRLKWGEMGSLHRRFSECLTQIKAKPLPEQSIEFRNLEYFLSYMGNGVPVSGPSTRK